MFWQSCFESKCRISIELSRKFFWLNRKYKSLDIWFVDLRNKTFWIECTTFSLNMAIGHISSEDGSLVLFILLEWGWKCSNTLVQTQLSRSFGAFNCIIWSSSADWIWTVIIKIFKSPSTVIMRFKGNSDKTVSKANSDLIFCLYYNFKNRTEFCQQWSSSGSAEVLQTTDLPKISKSGSNIFSWF